MNGKTVHLEGALTWALTWTLLVGLPGMGWAADSTKEFWEQRVAPLVATRCAGCHNRSERKGGLDLTSREKLLAGGDSGRVLVPGQPLQSLLWERVSRQEMPPTAPLSAADQEILREWLAQGAPWSGGELDPLQYTSDSRAGYDWWSLQPVRSQVPQAAASRTEASHEANAIDRFLGMRRHTAALEPSPAADRRVLIRRLSLDLTGLPPSLEEVAAFSADDRPDAYERLVDRLLASPAYGERWARHWLDVARFGESQGFERDKLRTNSWRYRDWVIDAWNEDLPYDQFARLQLAGDLLLPDRPEGTIATGFLVAGPYDEVGQNQQSAAMRVVVREDDLEDVASVMGQTFLGLTVNCSRCHDHKFDPVTQEEYYRLTAALAGVYHGQPKLAQGLPRDELLQQRISARLAAVERALAALPGGASSQRSALEFERDQLRQQADRVTDRSVYAVIAKQPATRHVLLRGNPTQRGSEVAPGAIRAVHSGTAADFGSAVNSPEAERRRKLVEWVCSSQNPLFSRVIANRLWHYHFGVGLVDTPNDLGFQGGRPSHPELLDWLAAELIRGDWSLKRLHRSIVTSAAYRQSSRLRPEALAKDAGNRLLWRQAPRRLDAETLRDTLLTIAGELNRELHGPGYYDFRTYVSNSQFYELLDPVGPSFQRRSLYRTWVRSGRQPFLDVFDCPDPSTKTPQRAQTTTPLQALALWNNSLVLRLTERFAEQIAAEVPREASAQVTAAWLRVLQRPPDAVEREVAETLLREHGLPALARLLFNSNELLYAD